jgi:hypothetical protein
MAVPIQLRRGTSAQWASVNPILAQGEIAVELDTHNFKIGDGINHWSALPFGGLVGATGATGAQGAAGISALTVLTPLIYDPVTQTLSIQTPSITDGGNF